jgi:hypothetical protein
VLFRSHRAPLRWRETDGRRLLLLPGGAFRPGPARCESAGGLGLTAALNAGRSIRPAGHRAGWSSEALRLRERPRAQPRMYRSSPRLIQLAGNTPRTVHRSSGRGRRRGQCSRASAHGDDRPAEAPWSPSPRGEHPPSATTHGPGWSPPSSRGFHTLTTGTDSTGAARLTTVRLRCRSTPPAPLLTRRRVPSPPPTRPPGVS